MGTVERSPRVAAMAVCLDQTSFEALSHFVAGVPGAVIIGNLDHYAGVEREVGRALDLAHTRICFIDYDRNTEEAGWVRERCAPNIQTCTPLLYLPFPSRKRSL